MGVVTAFLTLLLAPSAHAADRNTASAVIATPPGITLQSVSFGRGAGPTAFADARGLTLYTYDKDQPNTSLCVDDCTKAFPPLRVSPGAKAVGEWSIVKRGDGPAQWAWRGKPLYTSNKDAQIGDAKGQGEGEGAWKLAAFEPSAGSVLPLGFAVRQVGRANGVVMVDDREMTLYTFSGKPAKDALQCLGKPGCDMKWTPVEASELANAVGNFSVVARPDGTRQWAFNGQPLYTYKGDLEPGDANGTGIEKLYQPAFVAQFFMPANVKMGNLYGKGEVLTTADGMTLYRRDAYRFAPPGHALRNANPPRPAVGRDIGNEQRRSINAEYYPSLDIVLQSKYERDFNGLPGIRRDNTAKLQATWTLFSGLSTQSRSAQAAYDTDSRRNDYQQTRRKVEEQTRLAWHALQTARERVVLLDNAVNIASEVFASRTKLREAGKETVINVLDAENEVFSARINYASALYDAHLAAYQLLLAIGRLEIDALSTVAPPG